MGKDIQLQSGGDSLHWQLLYLCKRKVLIEQYAKNMSDGPMCGCILGEERIKIAEASANWLTLSLTPPFLDLGSLLAVSITTADACGRLTDSAFLGLKYPL